jgi:hypothetical protein
VAQKLLSRIDWWRDYTARNGDELNNNPSYGNKQGGLTTILEKSLGAVAKGGTMPLKAVYEYAEMVTEPGFVFMDTPGYDPAAVTGQVAGGCNVICFTTGRGSVSGFKPAPCIKIATNTEMYDHMDEDMDINCGGIVTGAETPRARRPQARSTTTATMNSCRGRWGRLLEPRVKHPSPTSAMGSHGSLRLRILSNKGRGKPLASPHKDYPAQAPPHLSGASHWSRPALRAPTRARA